MIYLAMRREWDSTEYPETRVSEKLETLVDWLTDFMGFEDQEEERQEEVRQELRALVNSELEEGVYGLIQMLEVLP